MGIFRRFILMAVLASAGAPAVAAEPQQEVRIGVLAYRGAEEAERTWEPTLSYLSRALPQYRFQIVTGTAAFLTAAVAAHRFDFVITNPGHYLELKVDYSAAALATEQDMDGPTSSEAIGAAVFVPSAHLEIQSLTDLRNLRVAAVAPDAFGFRAVWREMQERGLDPSKDLTLDFFGFPVDGIVRAVRSGKADAGIIRSCTLEKLIQEGVVASEEFRVIGRRPSGELKCQISTRLYPGWPFVKVAQTPAPLAREVAQALLTMQPGSDDKIWAQPDDYKSVQDLYRTLKVGPYSPFARLGLMDLLRENRYWAALIALAGAWWLIHVVRVSYLVKKRTKELQQAHEAARLKSEQMEHTVRLSLMGEMASSLAHEINQPLAAILTYARACERRIEAGSDIDRVREAVGRIAVHAERAGDIVRRMRKLVRKNPSKQLPIDAAIAFREALALFEPTATAAGVVVEADIPDSLPTICADRLQVEEIVLNLLQNALEATAGHADRSIKISVAATDGNLKVSVSDNGPGLLPGAREHLFEAFFTTKPNGLGLGLSLSRTIVEAHGGRLDFDVSKPGTTTFWFYLPLMEEAARV